MKKYFFIIITIISTHLLANETLSKIQKMFSSNNNFINTIEAKKMWGNQKFSAEEFKNNTKQRASMVVDLIESKILIGKDLTEVKALLGKQSGYYWNETILTYIIQEGWKENKDTWQIVFFTDNKQKVKKIKIHKNCCDKE